jgi:hypothetical protein
VFRNGTLIWQHLLPPETPTAACSLFGARLRQIDCDAGRSEHEKYGDRTHRVRVIHAGLRPTRGVTTWRGDWRAALHARAHRARQHSHRGSPPITTRNGSALSGAGQGQHGRSPSGLPSLLLRWKVCPTTGGDATNFLHISIRRRYSRQNLPEQSRKRSLGVASRLSLAAGFVLEYRRSPDNLRQPRRPIRVCAAITLGMKA